ACTEPGSLAPSRVIAEPGKYLEQAAKDERAAEGDEKCCPWPPRAIVRQQILDVIPQRGPDDSSGEYPTQRRCPQVQWPTSRRGSVRIDWQLGVRVRRRRRPSRVRHFLGIVRAADT